MRKTTPKCIEVSDNVKLQFLVPLDLLVVKNMYRKFEATWRGEARSSLKRKRCHSSFLYFAELQKAKWKNKKRDKRRYGSRTGLTVMISCRKWVAF